jgi:uncharacterized protein (DUF2141 family)
MRSTMRTAMVFFLLGLARAEGPSAGTLRVETRGLRSDAGQFGCLLFAAREGFPQDRSRALQAIWAKIVEGAASCVFTGVAPGSYAIATLHDENGNGKLDTNFVGAPKEGYGFSNGAHAHTFSPATFEEARIAFTGPAAVYSIPTVYP